MGLGLRISSGNELFGRTENERFLTESFLMEMEAVGNGGEWWWEEEEETLVVSSGELDVEKRVVESSVMHRF